MDLEVADRRERLDRLAQLVLADVEGRHVARDRAQRRLDLRRVGPARAGDRDLVDRDQRRVAQPEAGGDEQDQRAHGGKQPPAAREGGQAAHPPRRIRRGRRIASLARRSASRAAPLPFPFDAARDSSTESTRPYSTACSGVKKRSRSMSSRISSSSAAGVVRRRSPPSAGGARGPRVAWISMSVAWPWKPPWGWWVRIRLFGQGEALALRAAGEQERAHRHRDADARRLHVGADELHRVVDREARVDDAARRVDVDRDVLVGVVGLEVQQLGDDEVRDLVVDRGADEDDALAQQAGVDVERALAARVLLDDDGDERHG